MTAACRAQVNRGLSDVNPSFGGFNRTEAGTRDGIFLTGGLAVLFAWSRVGCTLGSARQATAMRWLNARSLELPKNRHAQEVP
jgi:hypothetical protein